MDLKSSFAFLDESGNLWHDPEQPLFGVCGILIPDTHQLTKSLEQITLKARQAFPRAKLFEFKFSSLVRDALPLYRAFLSEAFKQCGFEIVVHLYDKRSAHDHVSGITEIWDFYCGHYNWCLSALLEGKPKGIVIADSINSPRGQPPLSARLSLMTEVLNATVVESHGSVMLQLADVILGCTKYQWLHTLKYKDPDTSDPFKLDLARHLQSLMAVDTLGKEFRVDWPVKFVVVYSWPMH